MGEIEGLFAKAKKKTQDGRITLPSKGSVRVNGMLEGDVIKEMQLPIATPGFSYYPAVCGERSTLGGLRARTHLEPQENGERTLRAAQPPARRGDHQQMVSELGSPSKGNVRSPPKGKGEQEIPRRGKVNNQ